MTTIQQLLAFRHEALVQFVLVSTFFGACAFGGVMALISSNERGKLRERLFVTLAFASAAFMLATTLGVILLPVTGHALELSEAKARTMLQLYTLAVASIMLGTTLLAASLAMMGFLISKKAGVLSIIAAAVAAVVFGGAVVMFAGAMRGG